MVIAVCLAMAAAACPPVLSPAAEAADDDPLLVAGLSEGFHDPPPPSDPFPSRFDFVLPEPEPIEPAVHLAPLEDWQWLRRAARLQLPLPSRPVSDPAEPSLRLATSALDANDQRSVVGGRILFTQPTETRGRMHCEGRLLWLNETIQSESGSAGFFSPGNSNVFVVQGLSEGRNWAVLGSRVGWDLPGGLKAFAAYDTQANSQQMYHIGSTGLDYRW